MNRAEASSGDHPSGGTPEAAFVLDDLDPPAFADAVAPLFEGAPRFLARLAEARPFGSWERLFEGARRIAQAMPEAEQVELVDAHPRLGAPRATVSAMSHGEQGYDRPPDPAIETARAELAQLNAAYEDRFGFRYCVFVAGRPLPELIPGLRSALTAERGAELRRALDAVVNIAIARHGAATR